MKKLLLALALLLASSAVWAQTTGTLTATVANADTGETIPGAIVEIVPEGHPDQKKYQTTDIDGRVRLTGLAFGEYTLAVSFAGFDAEQLPVTIDSSARDLGRVALYESAIEIERVVVEAAMRASQRGDTLSYRASAFKTTADADVEGLLKKMPGLTVSDGTVEAQGEQIQKVFVDGKEFFGEDVTSAIKSLPAQAVDRVEVYDKLSDQAEFSGVDDGEGYKALNIVTKPNMRQGVFGKLSAGYGYDADTETEARHKYIAGGNVNWFNGSSRLSLMGLFNNLNQQNFSFEDILGVTGSTGGGGGRHAVGQYMVRPQSGVATANAVALNYSDEWGKRDQVTFQGSYFFSNTRTVNRSSIDRWYDYPAADTLHTDGYSRIVNDNHRLNARIEWKISDNQELMIRPRFSFQSNDRYSTTFGREFGERGYSVIDNLEDVLRNGFRAGTSAVYRIRLGKPGRTVTVNGSFNYSKNKNDRDSYSNAYPTIDYIDPETGEIIPGRPDDEDLIDLLSLHRTTPSHNYWINGRVTYTEPITPHAQLTFNYRATYEYEQTDRRTYDAEYENGGFVIGGRNDGLSNARRSTYLQHQVGPGFNYSKNRTTVTLGVNYQHSDLTGKVISGAPDRIRHNFDNVVYFGRAQIYLNPENSINLRLRSYTDEPDVQDLQDIYDLSDVQQISKGNPNLIPEYQHNLRFHYVRSSIEKGRTLMVMLGASTTQNYIGTSTEYDKPLVIDGENYTPRRYTEPVNLDGYWNLRSGISYGFPVGFIKSNLNLRGGVSYSLIPSLENGKRNRAGNIGYSAGLVLGSNISENIDFTLSWDGLYNEATNSLKSVSGANRYFYHAASASFKFIFGAGFSVMGSAAYQQYRGFTNRYNDDYLLCGLFLGKKVLKNMGEVSIGVNDIFNQNTAFSRTTGSGWTQNSVNSVIGRYYMVQFTYNLRFFGKKGSQNINDYEGMGRPMGTRGGMMPPH